MKTKLIQTKDYLLLIDEEAEILLGGYTYQINFEKTHSQIIKIETDFQAKIANDKKGSYTKHKIIAYYPLTKEAKELDLPLLPNPFKEKIDINEIAKQRAIDRKWHPDSMETRRVGNEIVEAVKYGYQIAQAKQFSLEDMKKAIEMARTLVEGKNEFEVENILGSSDGTYGISERYTEEEIIQSLSTQQLPKQFSLENINKAFDAGYQCKTNNGYMSNGTYYEDRNKFIQSLSTQQLPKEFILGKGETIEEQIKNGYYE